MKNKLPKNWGKIKGSSFFSPVNYTDGTPSREYDSRSCEDTMHDVFDKCRETSLAIDVSDRLSNLKRLVELCVEGLTNSSRSDIKTIVIDVLHFHVVQQIAIAQEEIANL